MCHFFNPLCEKELGEHDRYWVKCGPKRKKSLQSPSDYNQRTKTRDNFIKEKGKEAHNVFK